MCPARISSIRRAGDVTVALVNDVDVEYFSSLIKD